MIPACIITLYLAVLWLIVKVMLLDQRIAHRSNMSELFKVRPIAGAGWQVEGPSVEPHDSLWPDYEIAKRVAAALARAYVKGQESVLASREHDYELHERRARAVLLSKRCSYSPQACDELLQQIGSGPESPERVIEYAAANNLSLPEALDDVRGGA